MLLPFQLLLLLLLNFKIRNLGVNTKVFPLNIDSDTLVKNKVKAIVISGGPASANDTDLEYDKKVFHLGVPVLGVCLGMQIMAFQDEGKVEMMGLGERKVGQYLIDFDVSSKLFAGLEKKELVCLTHDETVVIPVSSIIHSFWVRVYCSSWTHDTLGKAQESYCKEFQLWA